MKKILVLCFALTFALVLSGCSQTAETEKQTDTSSGKSTEEQNNSKLAEELNSKNSSTSKQTQPNPTKKTTMTPTTQDNSALLEKYQGAVLKTNLGEIELEFFAQESPVTVGNFFKLAQEKFYDGTKFHRVIKDFMIQGGDPNSKDDDWSNDGTGGPGYAFQDEFNSQKLVRGSLAMANSGPNTNGSQFFIVTAESTPWLDGKHTNFGKVTKGIEVVDKIEKVEVNGNDHPTQDVVIESVVLIEK